MCTEVGCNIKNVEHQYCMRCDSKIDENCANLGDRYEYAKKCDGDPYSYKDRGCFTMTHRKCFSFC